MARKTIRRNGRYITIDTKTGREIKPGTAAWKAAASLYRGAQTLPSKAKRLVKEVGDTLIYSDKPDKKGRPQTIQQERVRKETADKNRKTGQKATLNGKPVVWKGGKWVPAPATSKKMANIPPAEAKPGSPSYVKPKTDKTSSTKASPPTDKKPEAPKKPAAPKKPEAPKPKGTQTQQELQGTSEFIKNFSGKKGMERAVEQAKKRRDRLKKQLNMQIRSDAQKTQNRSAA